MKRSAILIALALLMLVPVLTFAAGAGEGSAPAAAAKTELRLGWWGNPTRDERTLKVIDLYLSKNPNAGIEPETVGWGGYWDRINTQVAAGNLPDVMQHDYAYMLQFIARKQLADLTPYVNSKVINLAGVDESFLSGGRVDGKLYGVSLGTNALCIVYDPKILETAGIAAPAANYTWADFEKAAIQIFRKTGVQTLPFATTDPKVVFDNWIRQTGQSFYAKDGKSLGFTDSALLQEFFAIQLRLKSAGALVDPDVAFVNVTPQEDPFSKGKSWLQYVWSNQVVSTQVAANKPVQLALYPLIAGSKRSGLYLKPSMFFAIPEMGKNKDEAAKFVNFFVSDPDANKILLGERGVPIIASVRETVKAQVDPVMKQVFEYIDLVGKGNASPIDPPDPAASGEILKLFRDTTQAVLSGKTPARDGAVGFMKQANAILAK